MKNYWQKIVSLTIVLVMVVSLLPLSAIAVEVSDFTLTGDSVVLTGAEKTATVQWKSNAAQSIANFEGNWTTSLAGGKITLTSLTPGKITFVEGSHTLNPATGRMVWNAPSPAGVAHDAGDAVITAVYTVAADTAPGDYTVSITDLGVEIGSISGDDYFEEQTLTATITVSEATVVTDPAYEIYYTLTQTADAGSDGYKDYDDPDAPVIANVYLKSAANATLQAFDFTVINEAGLEIQSFAINTSIVNGSDVQYTINSAKTSIRVSLVGADLARPINHAMTAGTEVLLGTITYKFKDTTVNADQQDITITAPTHIAVAGTINDFVPDITGDVLGAEINKTYPVTYDDNVADAEITVPADGEKEYNKAFDVDFTVGTREGYTFLGWDRSASATDPEYKAGGTTQIPANVNEDVTLYAIWEVHTHTVTWMSQDGATTLETDANVPFGETLSYDAATHPIPEKEATDQYNFSFAGWAESANQTSGNPAESYVMGDADMVLYVAYSETLRQYTVTWVNYDDSVLETDENVDYGTTPTYDGATPTKPADATYTYTFDKWTPDVDVVSGNVTYKAEFTETKIDYTIKFAGGDHPADSVTLPADLTKNNGDTFNLPAAIAAAEGYTFAGWNDGVTTYNAGASYTLDWERAGLDKNSDTKTVTFTAMFTENKYNVVYDANHGTGTLPANHENVLYTASIIIGDGNGLERTGYTFAGWSTDPDATTAEYSAGNTVSKLSAEDGATVTLYAVWSTAAYTIEYDYDGADVQPANPTAYDVEDLPITLIVPTKTGYEFDGWTIAVKSGETGAVVIDSDNANVLKVGTYGNLTVKANWVEAEAPSTVKFFQQNITDDNYTEITADETTVTTGITGQLTSTVFTPAADKYAHFHLSTIEGKNVAVTILADGSTVLNIYYDRDTYTVTYQYTGSVPSGATAPTDANSPYRYGATVSIAGAPAAVAGYTFDGWDKTAAFVIDADTTITGTWSLITYHIVFKDDQGNVVETVDFNAETTSITPPAVPAKSEDPDWYDAGAWGAYDINTLDNQEVTPEYNKLTFTITFTDENDAPLPDQGPDPTYDIDDPTVVPPAVPEKPGYSGEWPTTGMTDVPGDHNVKPVYTAIGYTITFVTGGDPIAELAYTIESTDELPIATGKANFAFVTWKVTATDTEDSWASNSTINAGTPVTGRYGNVTLTAQWEVAITYEVNSYKYADDDEMLLIVDAANVGDGKVYTYAGATMYYTEDASYMIGTGSGMTTAVYFTLITANSNTLTDGQIANIEAVDGTPETITYDGDINGDGKITIADANVIYQMLAQDSKGAYYTGQLNVEQRLAADLDKTDAADFHGSIKDVEAAVAIVLTQTAKAEALDEMFANYVCVAEDLRKIRSIEA